MFRLFAQLTEYSNHYIDWPRALRVFERGRSNFSRAAIVGFTAVCGFVGYQYNENEKLSSSSLTIAIAAGALGFVVSHAFVVIPLIKKRYQINKECEQLMFEIETQIQANDNLTATQRQQIHESAKSILEISLTSDTQGNATYTWSIRKGLLNELLDIVSRPSEVFEEGMKDIRNKIAEKQNPSRRVVSYQI